MSIIFTRYSNFPDIFSNVFPSFFLQRKTFISECQICLAEMAKRARGKTANTAGFYVSFAFLDLAAKTALDIMLT